MEKLAIITNAGKAKVFGTLIGIGGAMVFTFYKGMDINIWSTNVNLLKHHHHQEVGLGSSYHGTGHFAIGAVFGLLSCISFSLWLIIQGPLYAAIFNPLGLVLVAIVGSLLLDEKLHLGSIIGGLMIVCGVYVVLWGKATEMKQKTLSVPVPTVDEESNEIEEDEQRENTGTDEEQEHEGTETPPEIVLA
ncbi:hypothetical protein PVK06_013232 [Gossypium arboreum]|uniref:WAT1-related protein n=1 Tax=Gossypium arboreum TaxID=29729 RepID=A0ABR0QEH5_GOSAR|nr:hypothetical protein PVK06_013232 [Gossypium arboreum]